MKIMRNKIMKKNNIYLKYKMMMKKAIYLIKLKKLLLYD